MMNYSLLQANCLRCGYKWIRRKATPRACPACKSIYWNCKRIENNCLRCGYKWKQTKNKRSPKCPSCSATYWDDLLEHNNKGKNNHRWNGGTSEYKNHYQLKKNRLIVLKASNYVCCVCGNKADRVHHKDGRKDNHAIDNLVACCHKCNLSYFHKNRRHKATRFGIPYAVIGENIGVCGHTVSNHLSGKRKSKRYGPLIEATLKELLKRKEKEGLFWRNK